MADELLEKFKKNGYFVAEPFKSDKTYYISKHTLKEDRAIWIKLKKTPEVEVFLNRKKTKLLDVESDLISELLNSLGYDDFKVIK